jgi:uncharacterized protein YdiU (UPF0061 family)
MEWSPARDIEELGAGFYDPVTPARFPKAELRFRNQRAAAEVGLEGLSDTDWLHRFWAFEPFEGSLPHPLALRYHGHQFRMYNPDIGDGRGFLYAQCRDARGRLMDFGTKGSGQTPYSRFGDGRLTLKGAVREVLATEMLEALGVPTSRTFSVVETGEGLDRNDEPSPTRSAVLTRLSHGHIRIGTFQRLAALGEDSNMRGLVRYVRVHLHGGSEDDTPAALLATTAAACAETVARQMAAGFVHGVLNTDNINVTGESFDYGPWRFLPAWEPGFTAAYFDHAGLYAFARQPEAVQWNLLQLGRALRLVSEAEPLVPAINGFGALYEAAFARAMLWRLGLRPRGEAEDLAAVQALEQAMAGGGAQPDRVFFDWRGGAARRAGYDAAEWTALARALERHEREPDALAHPYWDGEAPQTMLIDQVESIWAAIDERDDWAPFDAKIAAVRRMGEAHA